MLYLKDIQCMRSHASKHPGDSRFVEHIKGASQTVVIEIFCCQTFTYQQINRFVVKELWCQRNLLLQGAPNEPRSVENHCLRSFTNTHFSSCDTYTGVNLFYETNLLAYTSNNTQMIQSLCAIDFFSHVLSSLRDEFLKKDNTILSQMPLKGAEYRLLESKTPELFDLKEAESP